MTTGFENPLVGGDGTLVYPAIKSPGFTQSPLSGWSIDKNGNAYFETVTIGGGIVKVTFAGTAPDDPNTGDVWFNLDQGAQPNSWNGTEWVAYSWGTGAIADGAIGATQIAAETVVAGIIDGTTVNAATFTGSVFEGLDYIINANGAFFYSGTPAKGNLVIALANSDGTDAYGNTYVLGLQVSGDGIITINGEGVLDVGGVNCGAIGCLDLTVSDTLTVGEITYSGTVQAGPSQYPLTIGNTEAENEACQELANYLCVVLRNLGVMTT